jgi:hypothetical protein
MSTLNFKLQINQTSGAVFEDYKIVDMILEINTKIPNAITIGLTADEYLKCKSNFVPIWTNLNILPTSVIRAALERMMEGLAYNLNSEFNLEQFFHTALRAGDYLNKYKLPPQTPTQTNFSIAMFSVSCSNYWEEVENAQHKLDLVGFFKEPSNSPNVIPLGSSVQSFRDLTDEHYCSVISTQFAVKTNWINDSLDTTVSQNLIDTYAYRSLLHWFSLFTNRSKIAKDLFYYDAATQEKQLSLQISYGKLSKLSYNNYVATTLKKALSYFTTSTYAIKTANVKTLKEVLRVANLLPMRKSN